MPALSNSCHFRCTKNVSVHAARDENGNVSDLNNKRKMLTEGSTIQHRPGDKWFLLASDVSEK